MPGSPSSIVPLDETQPLQSQKMLAVTKDWVLDGNVLRPTRTHLYDYCRRVSTLLKGDRVVHFICKFPAAVESCSVFVHLSRIQAQGGKLWHLVSPHIHKSMSHIIIVRIEESGLGMLVISDFLYRSHIDLAALEVSDLFEIASAAMRWECVDLYHGSLLQIVLQKRLEYPLRIRETVCFRWLLQAPEIVLKYFCEGAERTLSSITYVQLLQVLQGAHLSSAAELFILVLRFIVKNNSVKTVFHCRCLLHVFLEIDVPVMFKHYFSAKIRRFFFDLQLPCCIPDKACSEDHTTEKDDFAFAAFSSRPPLCMRRFIAVLDKNDILLETLRTIDASCSNAYDPKSMFWILLHYVEPLVSDETTLIQLLRYTCAQIGDRQSLASDENHWKRVSGRAMRVAAVSLSSMRCHAPTLLLSLRIPWDSLSAGSSTDMAIGSIANVKFELKARSSSIRKCSWRLYYSNVEGCTGPRTVSYASVSYEVSNTRCCCDDVTSRERVTKVKLKDRGLKNGSVMDLHTEGELTLLSHEEVNAWCNLHKKTCLLSIFVTITLS